MNTRKLSLWILISILFFTAAYITWNMMNKGFITVTAKVPFTMQFDSAAPLVCSTGSCTLTIRPGTHDLVIFKEGYMNFFGKVNVNRNETAQVSIKLEKIPNVSEAKEKKVLRPSRSNPFTLITNKETGRQTLKKKDEVIAYFNRPFVTPNIIADAQQKHVWIRDDATIYSIDTIEKTRTNIYETTDVIRDIIPSPSGSTLLIILSDSMDAIRNVSQVVAKISVKLATTGHVAWKDETTFFLVERGDDGDTLKRANLDSASGALQARQLESIKKWGTDAEKIDFIFFDEAKNQLKIQGEKSVYQLDL